MKLHSYLATFCLIILLNGCDSIGYGGYALYLGNLTEFKLSTPKEAHVNLSDQTLNEIDDKLSQILFQYLAGNPRWEIREVRGLRYAVRLEPTDNSFNDSFKSTLNGFYSHHYGNNQVRQTRVLISFGKEYAFGNERGNITRTKVGEKNTPVIIESEHDGLPGNSSYTIVSADKLFLEIYDQAPELKRLFTQEAFNQVSAELKNVITHQATIKKTGIMPEPDYYPLPLPKKNYFEINDGMQPGIFQLDAAINTTESGLAYVKAFNVKTGDQLSKDRMTSRSTRHMGWSEDGKTLFHYQSEITVYEGDWESTYKARFELWYRSNKGTEKKLAEKTRMIQGWER